MKHIVQYSFGESSWYAGKLTVERFGPDDVIHLFADTMSEDEDTYRWGRIGASKIGGHLVEIADGRNIWQVFRDSRMIGNTRADPCSRILNREICDQWIKERFKPDECVLYYGIGLFEKERADAIRARVLPYRAEFPLLAPPYPGPAQVREAVLAAGLWVQDLYREGFPHANCGGACVKGGQGQWLRLLEKRPDAFRHNEEQEEAVRRFLGKDVAILRDRRGGTTKPLTLQQLRLRSEAGEKCEEPGPAGACGCFADADDDESMA